MLRFAALSLVLVGRASAQCDLCPDGALPGNPDASIAAIGGITCRYFFYDADGIPPTSQQCLTVQKPEIQQLCGCSSSVPVAVTAAPVVSRQEVPEVPVVVELPTPTTATSTSCQVCLNGGPPGNPGAAVPDIGGLTCGFFYFNSAGVSPNSQQCVAIRKSENQLLCGCGGAVVATPVPTVAPLTSAPIDRGDETLVPEIPIPTPAPVTTQTTPAPIVPPTPEPTKPPTNKPTDEPVVVVPVTPAPVPSNSCNVCIDGSKPGNMGAVLDDLGGFTCGYFYFNGDFARPGGQQCTIAHLPSNQAICGCPPPAPTRSPVDRGDGPSVPVTVMTPAPVAVMTPAPIVVMTPAPVVPPTPAPIVVTTPAPVVPPTPAPIVVTTPAPVVPPTPAPIVVTTPAPVVPPTPEPTKPPTNKPTDEPVVPDTLAPATSAPAPASTSCQLCLNGEMPPNMGATIDAIGGFTCGFFYNNAPSSTGQQCQAVHAQDVQELCGCSSSSIPENRVSAQQTMQDFTSGATGVVVSRMASILVAVTVGAVVVMM